MERPKLQEQAPQEREITGEIVYLDAMRRAGQWPEPYAGLPDMAMQMYEGEAALYRNNGVPHLPIMDEYEMYDQPTPALEASCIALADELLLHRDSDSQWSFIDIIVETPAEEVLTRLQGSLAGQLLAKADEQLAIESDGSYYPVLDIRKSEAKLTGVGVRAWGWEYDKTVRTDKVDESYDYNKHVLVYPANEKQQVRQLDISFSYGHPASRFRETISLRASSDGGVTLHRDIWALAYAETGYEGHAGKSLKRAKKQAAAEFADLVAEIVGDTPESVSEERERVYREYEKQVIVPESLLYLQEWVENSWVGQVMYDLTQIRIDAAPASDITLYKALTMPEHVHEAHNALVDHVNYRRAERNKSANNKELVRALGTIDRWVDLAPRTMPTPRIAQSPQPPTH